MMQSTQEESNVIKAALTVCISSEDLQKATCLVNDARLGLLSNSSQNIHIQTSHKPIQFIIGIRKDENEAELSRQKQTLSRWESFLPVFMRRGCTELNTLLTQYKLQPDLMICYDQMRLYAWMPNEFGIYLLRGSELHKLCPIAFQNPIFSQAYHDLHDYYTLKLHESDIYLFLPPDLPSFFEPDEVVDLLTGLRQLPAKMSELIRIAKQRGYQRESSWMAVDIQKKEADYRIPADRSFLGNRLSGRLNTRAETKEANSVPNSDSECMTGKEKEKTSQPLAFWDQLQSSRAFRPALILITALILILSVFAAGKAMGIWGGQPETSRSTLTETTPVPTPTRQPTPTAAPTVTPVPTKPPVQLVVSARRLNLREAPGKDSKLLTTLEKGAVLIQLEEPENDWVRVQTEDGLIGYVYAQYVKTSEEP